MGPIDYPSQVNPLMFFNSHIESNPSSATNPNLYISANQKILDDLGIGIDMIPEDFICPLSAQVMDNPVTNKDKSLPPVEKTMIEKVINTSHKNPFNKKPLSIADLIPDTKLQAEITTFVSQHVNQNNETPNSTLGQVK